MKLILITPPTYFVEEDKIITALFEEGLDTLHLRKPGTAPMFAERLLTLIPRTISQTHRGSRTFLSERGIQTERNSPERS